MDAHPGWTGPRLPGLSADGIHESVPPHEPPTATWPGRDGGRDAAAGAAHSARAYAVARRDLRFRALWQRSSIGEHRVAFRMDGDRLVVDTHIDIAVRVLFFTVFRLKHDAQEIWQSGRLVSVRLWPKPPRWPIQPGTVDPDQRWVWHTRPRFILPLWEHASAGAAQRYVRLAQTRRTARTWQLNTGAAAMRTPLRARCQHSHDQAAQRSRHLPAAIRASPPSSRDQDPTRSPC